MRKKRISIIIACAVTLLGALPIFAKVGDIVSISVSSSTSVSVSETVEMEMGDANGDGMIDTDDALLVLKHAVGLDSTGLIPELSDVNNDDLIDTDDALDILRYAVGIR